MYLVIRELFRILEMCYYVLPRMRIYRALNLTALLGVTLHSFSGASTFIKHGHTKNVPLGSRWIQCRNFSLVCASIAIQLNGTAQIFLQLSFAVCLANTSRNDGCTMITVLIVVKNSSSTFPSSMSECIFYNILSLHLHITMAPSVSKGDKLFKSNFNLLYS